MESMIIEWEPTYNDFFNMAINSNCYSPYASSARSYSDVGCCTSQYFDNNNKTIKWQIKMKRMGKRDVAFRLTLIKLMVANHRTLPTVKALFEIVKDPHVHCTGGLFGNCSANNLTVNDGLDCGIDYGYKSVVDDQVSYLHMDADPSYILIRCEITVLYVVKGLTHVPKQIPIGIRLFENVLSQDLSADSTFADVILTTGDEKVFRVHSCFLAEQSSLFKAMLQSESFVEGKTRKITVSDINSKEMMKVLRYIYTETATDALVPVAVNVLYAAEKYFLSDTFKYHCHQVLKDNLCIANALEYLVIVDNLHRKR